MLSYRHEFHAGNYADVLKHIVLCQIFTYMVKKDKPLLYLDTHAGAGRYDLRSERANKTAEYKTGVVSLLRYGKPLPETIDGYVTYLKKLNPEAPVTYPGSPMLAKHFLRGTDRMILCERHPSDFPILQQVFAREKNVLCVKENGFEKALAVLPPKEKRGFVQIDPPYEVKTEYQWVVDCIRKSLKRFASGVYTIWYPRAHEALTTQMITAIKESTARPLHLYEIGKTRDHTLPGMTGAGMLVINPPWILMDAMTQTLPVLAEIMCPGGYWRCETLIQ